MGAESIMRLDYLFCLYFRKSATINLAERNAVSPDVMGAATTPIIANTPPNLPSHVYEILLYNNSSIIPLSAKNVYDHYITEELMAAAAHITCDNCF